MLHEILLRKIGRVKISASVTTESWSWEDLGDCNGSVTWTRYNTPPDGKHLEKYTVEREQLNGDLRYYTCHNGKRVGMYETSGQAHDAAKPSAWLPLPHNGRDQAWWKAPSMAETGHTDEAAYREGMEATYTWACKLFREEINICCLNVKVMWGDEVVGNSGMGGIEIEGYNANIIEATMREAIESYGLIEDAWKSAQVWLQHRVASLPRKYRNQIMLEELDLGSGEES